jgi:L-alanine-DL-glutamate epimerase-like enolase superfamily enzyme
VRINAVEPIAISLPMKKPVQMAGETVARADNVFVRIESDDGVVGWGEAASAPTMTGETVASMMAAIAHMAPSLLRHAADDFAGVAAAMDARMYGNSGAKAAIDIALYDLVGRAIGRPVYALLGEKMRSRMPVLAVIGSDDGSADLRDAEARYAAGYRAFKIKVGLATPQADAERTRRICAVETADQGLPGFGRRQSRLQRRGGPGLRASGRRLRPRFFRTTGRGACAWRHGPHRRGDPDSDRRRRRHSFARRHRTPS